MANVVTQTEMMKFRGAAKAFFSEGTILTPSAKDWAKEQGIEIAFGSEPCAVSNEGSCLDSIVAAVINEYKKAGKSLVKEDIVSAVELVLSRLNVG